MADRKLSGNTEYSILSDWLEGKNYKQVAYDNDVAPSTAYDVKKRYPLFFWKKDDD